MKKLGKFLMVGALAATMTVGTVAFAACGNDGSSYTGEYHYTNYGHEYGVKVEVKISNAKNILESKITSVKIVDSEYIQLSDANPDYGWTDENRKVYTDGEAALLKAYKGKTAIEVASYVQVEKKENGEPTGIEALTVPGLNVSVSDYVITGATQSSGRLLLAVQDAIEEWAEANKEAIQKAMADAIQKG